MVPPVELAPPLVLLVVLPEALLRSCRSRPRQGWPVCHRTGRSLLLPGRLVPLERLALPAEEQLLLPGWPHSCHRRPLHLDSGCCIVDRYSF